MNGDGLIADLMEKSRERERLALARPLVNEYSVEERTATVREIGPMVQLGYDNILTASTPAGIRQMRRLLNEVEDALVRLEQREGWA